MKIYQSYLVNIDEININNYENIIKEIYDIKWVRYKSKREDIIKLRERLYEKIIYDLEYIIIEKNHKNILFQIPLSHSINFLWKLLLSTAVR